MWLGSCYKDYAEILGNIAPLKILEFTEECSEKKGKKKSTLKILLAWEN